MNMAKMAQTICTKNIGIIGFYNGTDVTTDGYTNTSVRATESLPICCSVHFHKKEKHS